MFQWTTYNDKPQTVPPVNRVPIGEAQYQRIVSRWRRNLAGLGLNPAFLGPPIYQCEGGPRGANCAQPIGSATGGPDYGAGGTLPMPGGLPYGNDGLTPSPTTQPSSGLSSIFQGIPTSYLLIGGAVGLWFLMKKK